MNFIKKLSALILSLFVGLLVGSVIYFVILALPVFIFDTSSWTVDDAEAMKGYAIVGAFIGFALLAQMIYKKVV